MVYTYCKKFTLFVILTLIQCKKLDNKGKLSLGSWNKRHVLDENEEHSGSFEKCIQGSAVFTYSSFCLRGFTGKSLGQSLNTYHCTIVGDSSYATLLPLRSFTEVGLHPCLKGLHVFSSSSPFISFAIPPINLLHIYTCLHVCFGEAPDSPKKPCKP